MRLTLFICISVLVNPLGNQLQSCLMWLAKENKKRDAKATGGVDMCEFKTIFGREIPELLIFFCLLLVLLLCFVLVVLAVFVSMYQKVMINAVYLFCIVLQL